MTARPMAVCLARSLVKLQALRILDRVAGSLFRPLDSRTSQRARDADVNRIAVGTGASSISTPTARLASAVAGRTSWLPWLAMAE